MKWRLELNSSIVTANVSSPQSDMGHCLRAMSEDNSGRGEPSRVLRQVLPQWKVHSSSHVGQVRTCVCVCVRVCVGGWGGGGVSPRI